MISALNLNMANGEHVYIAMMAFRHITSGNFTWDFGDELNEQAKKAFQSLIILEPDNSIYGTTNNSDSADLIQEWKKISRWKYNDPYQPNEDVSPYVASSYAAVTIFAQVISELHSNKMSTKDWLDLYGGKEIAKRFFNRTFSLLTGLVAFDEAGERIPTLTVRYMNITSGKFEVVILQTQTFLLVELQPILWPGAWPPPSQPRCGFGGVCVHSVQPMNFKAAAAGVGVIILCSSTVFVAGALKKSARNAKVANTWWQLNDSLLTVSSKTDRANRFIKIHNVYGAAIYNGQHNVWLTEVAGNLQILPDDFLTKIAAKPDIVKFLSELRSLVHPNINSLLGLCRTGTHFFFVNSLCLRGSLTNLIESASLNWDMQISLMVDLSAGMACLHRSELGHHGYLTASKCLIDNYFTLQVGDLGFQQLRNEIMENNTGNLSPAVNSQRNLLWAAPEILRKETDPTLASDVYSVGIILNQIIMLSEPFEEYLLMNSTTINDLLLEIANSAEKPLHPLAVYPKSPEYLSRLRTIITNCWAYYPHYRPGMGIVQKQILRVAGEGTGNCRNIVEKIMRRLQKYAQELDDEVNIRTRALVEERLKLDMLLAEVFPRQVVTLLRIGQEIHPEIFDSVSVMFSEIFGFSALVVSVPPIEVLQFLNNVYSAFDQQILRYDVYKVETVKNSYMVTSGLPNRNYDNHIKEICGLAIALLKSYHPFTIVKSMTSLASGVHTGPCAAGIVGHKSPRYCLFGDTVNTAARILSLSESSKIHLSASSAALVSQFLGFFVTARGSVFVKGKGYMSTFWLHPDLDEETCNWQ